MTFKDFYVYIYLNSRKIGKANSGRKMSEITKQKMSIAKKGKIRGKYNKSNINKI